MAKGLVYGSVDPSSILAPFIDFLFFSLILWKFSKLEAGFGYITPLHANNTTMYSTDHRQLNIYSRVLAKTPRARVAILADTRTLPASGSQARARDLSSHALRAPRAHAHCTRWTTPYQRASRPCTLNW